MLLVLFPAVPTKTMVYGSFTRNVYVEGLTSFYVGSSLKRDNLLSQSPSTSSLHLGCHFFHSLTPPRFGALNLPEMNKFTGNCFRMVCIVLKITFLKF